MGTAWISSKKREGEGVCEGEEVGDVGKEREKEEGEGKEGGGKNEKGEALSGVNEVRNSRVCVEGGRVRRMEKDIETACERSSLWRDEALTGRQSLTPAPILEVLKETRPMGRYQFSRPVDRPRIMVDRPFDWEWSSGEIGTNKIFSLKYLKTPDGKESFESLLDDFPPLGSETQKERFHGNGARFPTPKHWAEEALTAQEVGEVLTDHDAENALSEERIAKECVACPGYKAWIDLVDGSEDVKCKPSK